MNVLPLLRRTAVSLFALVPLACAPPHTMATGISSPPLPGTDGAMHPIAPSDSTRFTVVVFFAHHCPCQAAHDARLREIDASYRPKGVNLVLVDSEGGASAEHDLTEATTRDYPFPILIDRGGVLAHKLGAEYATETFVLDRFGDVRYHGGIDSDKRTLHDNAQPYLRDALDDLLAGVPVRNAETKALGCSLQTW